MFAKKFSKPKSVGASTELTRITDDRLTEIIRGLTYDELNDSIAAEAWISEDEELELR